MNQGFKEDEFAFLSEMIGPKGMAFDNDDVLEASDDEDLKSDPISQMDMQVSLMLSSQLSCNLPSSTGPHHKFLTGVRAT